MNNKNKSESKLAATLFSLVFTLAFGTAALLVGLIPLSKIAWYWYQTQYYQPVQAQLSELRVAVDSVDGSARLLGRLQYSFQSDQLDLRAQTLAIADELESDSAITQLYERYHKSRQLGILVHPNRPQSYVIPREISSRKVWLLGVASLIFSLIAIASASIGVSIWRRHQFLHAQPDQALKLHSERLSLAAFLFASLFWNGIAWPLAYLALFSEQGQFRFGWQIFVVIFPLVGIYLVLAMLKQIYRDWQIGDVVLSSFKQLNNTDEHFTLQCHFDLPLGQRFTQQQTHYSIEPRLVCKHSDRNGDSETVTVFFEQSYAPVSVVHGAQTCQLKLDLKSDLPATQSYDKGSQNVSWELSLAIADCLVKFELPVHDGHADQPITPSPELMRDIRDQNFQHHHSPEKTLATVSRIKLISFFVLFAIVNLTVFYYFIYRDHGESQSQGNTEVMQSAPLDTASIKQKIIDGVSLNQFDQNGETLLMRAADQANAEQVELLLKNGAEVDLATAYVGDIGGRTALFNAIKHDAIDVVRLLLRAGANPQKVSNQVWTPVHYAAYAGALQSLRELAAQGLDLQQKFEGARGSTALMIAAQYEQVAVIDYLLNEAQVDPLVKDNYGEDACGYARFFKKPAALKALACE